MTTKLSDNHRRSLSVTAKTVEETIDQLEALLQAKPSSKLMRKISRTFTREERHRLLTELQTLRTANEEMIKELDLQKQEIDERQIVNASLTHLWLILSDSLSNKLKNFGPINVDTAKIIDQHIKKMIELIKRLGK